MEIVTIGLILVILLFVISQIVPSKLYKESVVFFVNGIPRKAVTQLTALFFICYTDFFLLDKFVFNFQFENSRYITIHFMIFGFLLAVIIQLHNYLVVLNKKGVQGYFFWKIKWSEIEDYSIDKERGEIVIKGSKQRVIRNIRRANWQEVEKMFAEKTGNRQNILPPVS